MKFFKSLFYNLHVNTLFAIAIIFSILLSLSTTYYIIFTKKEDAFIAKLKQEQNTCLEILSTAIKPSLDTKNIKRIKEITETIFLNDNIVKINIYNKQNEVIYHKLLLDMAKEKILTQDKAIYHNHRYIGRVEISASNYPLNLRLHSYLFEAISVFLLQFVVTTALLMLIIYYKISSPLKRLIAFSQDIQSMQKQEEWLYEDEINSLGKSLVQIKNNITQLITKDPLTKIDNRYALQNKLNELEKQNTPFCIVFFNIDNLTEIVDTYGFKQSEEVFKAVVNFVQKQRLNHHTFGRWNHEEFMVIFPNLKLEEAYALTKNLQENIDAKTLLPAVHVTCSFGISAYKKDEELSSLLARVDKALFMAKVEGKNRVVTL